ncbi:hypothetical protein EDB86DRAFT_3089826 [Lactarius hatsudake]|nr:hypothetical protein EDB86DRAFT_3089826 [Lactarius hatsudake]
MPPSWANITKQGAQQQQQRADQAKAVTGGTFRSAAGKARPETVQRRAASGNTEVMVIRHRGLDDVAMETTIRQTPPLTIIADTRSEIERLTGGRIVLLSGRWSSNKNKSIHNFVYTFKDNVPFRSLYPLRDMLVKPLMTGQLVPNDGWTFAQNRDTFTKDSAGTVYSGTQLEQELRRNPAFEDAIFCVAPHWQGSLHNVAQQPKGTVKFAYVDENGQITARAKRDSVFLFNEKARFVPTGDVATIQLCGRCHRIGHATNSTACPLPENAVRCYICGGSHHSNDHANQCPRPHDKVGVCRCLFPCINCGGGHNARSPHCKLKMGFSPPPLAPPPAANPKPSAKGKEPANRTSEAAAADDLVSTQRDPPPPEEPFTTVSRKGARKAKGRAAKTAANAAVPGSSAYSRPPAPAPPKQGRLTSKVPARPINRSKAYPTPPTWREAPVIHARHVATDLECAAAMKQLFGHKPTPEELRSLHVAWGGHESDEEATALWTLHFRWAVKYGLPLTTAHAINTITGNIAETAASNLLRFEEDWGPATPRNYLLSTIPRDQYFAHPGDLEETIISLEDATHNRKMACLLIDSCIKFKTLEAKANGTAPPPTITEPIIDAVLNLYSHSGTYSFFSLVKATTEDNDMWTAILDVHASSTAVILSYA